METEPGITLIVSHGARAFNGHGHFRITTRHDAEAPFPSSRMK